MAIFDAEQIMTSLTAERKGGAATYLLRATICHIVGDPLNSDDDSQSLEGFEDGALVYDDTGKILSSGPYASLAQRYKDAIVLDMSGCLVLPGFVDCHIHLPQALMIGAFGEELLDWLSRHTRPEELRYKDPEYARSCAQTFFDQEIASGTTTALIFGPHFEEALTLAFNEAEKRNFRAILGLTLEDRDAPADLLRTPQDAYKISKRLIERWHGKGKLGYVVTPRFALTCSSEMLGVCKRLLDEHPDVYFQTHLNENHKEILRLKELFADSTNYLDVYNRFGLLGSRSIFHHSIYSSEEEINLLAATESRVVHCPSSNLFLGSGLMPLGKYIAKGIFTALGTDVGAGTGFCMLKELDNAYKIQSVLMFADERVNDAVKLTGVKLLYLITLAGARALRLDGEIGNFKPGKRADAVIIDPSLDPYVEARLSNTRSLSERLFVLSILGSKQIIKDVLIDGRSSKLAAQAASNKVTGKVTVSH
jgi:guanine deaminase